MVEDPHLSVHADDDVGEALRGIGRRSKSNNVERPPQAPGYQSPGAFYRGLVQAASRPRSQMQVANRAERRVL